MVMEPPMEKNLKLVQHVMEAVKYVLNKVDFLYLKPPVLNVEVLVVSLLKNVKNAEELVKNELKNLLKLKYRLVLNMVHVCAFQKKEKSAKTVDQMVTYTYLLASKIMKHMSAMVQIYI